VLVCAVLAVGFLVFKPTAFGRWPQIIFGVCAVGAELLSWLLLGVIERSATRGDK
jgi:hypothetical protein